MKVLFVVLGDAAQAETFAGLPFEAFSAPQPWRPLAPMSLPRMGLSLARTGASRSIAADLVRVAERERPDVVLVDCMLPGPLAAAQRAGLRTATLVHSLPSYFAGPYLHGPVGVLTAAHGVRTARAWAGADATLATGTGRD